MRLLPSLAAAFTLTVSAIPALAHTDALLAIDPDGKLVTGEYDGAVQSVDTRVFEGEFDGPYSNVWTSAEPGFNALPTSNSGLLPAGYTVLPGSASVTFDAKTFSISGDTSNLWHWDGSGSVSFAPVTGTTQLEISKSPSAVYSSILDGSATDVSGFEIDSTDSNGLLHKHLDFTISNTDASAPATGFYLWSMTFEVGALESDPVYFVHGLGLEDEEAHEAAIAFVESTVVPEPTSALLLAGLGGLAMLRRRRRLA